MKTIEVKEGAKTKIKIVEDNYTEDAVCLLQNDLTTSGRKSIGFIDISKDKWNCIFNK